MKNLLFRMSLLCLMAVAFSGCDPTPSATGDFNLKVKSVGTDYVELNVTAPSSVEMAYVLSAEADALSAQVIFLTGKAMTVNPGDVIRIDEIQPGTDYNLYAAAKLDEQNYSGVVALKFTTEKYGFNRLLTLLDTYYDGYKIHFTLPESTKKNGNVIRYNMVDQAMYNILVKEVAMGDEASHVLESVVMNGFRHGKYVKNDSTCVFNHDNQVLTDEDGDPIKGSDGEMIDIHLPSAPGEPTVFLAGECRWGTDDEMGAIVGVYYGVKDKSYQVPLFDWKTVQKNFDWSMTDRDDWTGTGWTGAFQKLVFKTKDPLPSDVTVNIDIPEDEITVTGANIYFEMEEGVDRYCYMVLDNSTYNLVLDLYLDKVGASEEEIDKAMQWLVTSYTALVELGVTAKTESTMINAAEWTTDLALTGGETYHVICTAMVDDPTIEHNPENGAYQSFVHKKFQARPKTKSAPVIEVKAVEPKAEFWASFNIKAPNKDLAGAYYAANYSREFQLMLNSGYTYETLLKGNNKLTADDIKKVNSDEGLVIHVPSLDGEEIRLAIYGCNDENTYNIIDSKKEGKGWADCQVPMAEKAPRINSPLYAALAGDWTATATAKINEQDEDGTVISRNAELKSKITISMDVPNMPDAVDENVYKIYQEIGKFSRDDVDGMFEELCILSDRFSEYRVQGQNRLLCTGFLDYDYYDNGRMAYKSPYDLFGDANYNSVDVPQLVYDFGPKWFLQLHDDGSVTVPFSTAYLPPMHSWPGYPFYVSGVGDGTAVMDGENATSSILPGFPVEISADYKKITIKPIVRGDVSYYMNAVGVSSNGYEIISTILTDIVLTKGWDGSDKSRTKASAPAAVPAMVSGPADAPEAQVFKSVTKLEPAPQKTFKVDENPNIITKDMVNESVKRIRQRYGVE